MRSFIASAFALTIASIAPAQNILSNRESGDILADCTTVTSASGAAVLYSPFNYGLVEAPNSGLMGMNIVDYSYDAGGLTVYQPDLFIGSVGPSIVSDFGSQIYWNIGVSAQMPGTSFSIPAYSLVMEASQYIPCIETKIPKGTYTFQGTATPIGGTSTPGTFQFQTYTEGVWTVQFSLALPKPEGATRTLTFAHDTKVRWMLISQPQQQAVAAITARYYSTGS